MEDDEASNQTSNSLLDYVVTMAHCLYIFLHSTFTRSPILSVHELQHLGYIASQTTLDWLFDALEEFEYPAETLFLITSNHLQDGADQPNSLEIVVDNEADSIAISNAPPDKVRELIRCFFNRKNDSFYSHMKKRIDPCQCGHAFHSFVIEELIKFSASPTTAWADQVIRRRGIHPNRDPLKELRHNRKKFRCPSYTHYLLCFKKHVVSLERNDSSKWLLHMIDRQLGQLLRSSRCFSTPDNLPDVCPFSGGADEAINLTWPPIYDSTEEADPDWNQQSVLLASRSQTDILIYGDAAGMQCVAMCAMVIRLHYLMDGSFSNMSRAMLDLVLDHGNELYKICAKANRWGYNQQLNYDELRIGMYQFDRQGWPAFSDVELNPDSWERLASDVDRAFRSNHNGFLMIMNGRAVAVMRDSSMGQFFLFDSHGSDLFPDFSERNNHEVLHANERQGYENFPAFLQRCSTLDELIMNLRYHYGRFSFCEIHVYN